MHSVKGIKSFSLGGISSERTGLWLWRHFVCCASVGRRWSCSSLARSIFSYQMRGFICWAICRTVSCRSISIYAMYSACRRSSRRMGWCFLRRLRSGFLVLAGMPMRCRTSSRTARRAICCGARRRRNWQTSWIGRLAISSWRPMSANVGISMCRNIPGIRWRGASMR